jgi:hypothetical protein
MEHTPEEEEKIRCLLCPGGGSVARYELKDHIRGTHFGHCPHLCQDCGLSFDSGEMAWKHAGETDHRVLLNQVGVFSCVL